MGELMTYLSVKVGAAGFVYGWATGRMSKPEQLKANRVELAQRVWDEMRSRDSAECRNCHKMEAMDLSLQTRRAAEEHRDAEKDGKTCIDCHNDGVAHAPVVVEKSPDEEETWGDDAFRIE
jgi:cytochrome c-type protein NapC